MSAEKKQNTEVHFDLADVLTARELESFQEKAKESNRDVTEHFLAVTLGLEPKPAA